MIAGLSNTAAGTTELREVIGKKAVQFTRRTADAELQQSLLEGAYLVAYRISGHLVPPRSVYA